MSERQGVFLPKEKGMETEAVRDVAGYIDRVNLYSKRRRENGSLSVYRGEPEIYENPCRPNIFRRGVLNGNDFFEKNLFDAMRQNRLTGENRYLENAIDAQHGEFPSRLLDVSYNCLTALYFAVTPYYREKVTSKDNRDGMVYIFFLDEIFSPSAENTNSAYEAVINRTPEWYRKNALFERNYKFIDHAKINNRIIAQQGAFLLFPGQEPGNLPEYMYCGIRIAGEAKPQIRQQLKTLFGIHTGSIYPEMINLVEELNEKSKRLNTQPFSCENELDNALRHLEKELAFYLNYAAEQRGEKEGETAAFWDLILADIERRLDDWHRGLVEFLQNYQRDGENGMGAYIEKEKLIGQIHRYNQLLDRFARQFTQYTGRAVFCEEMQIQVKR